jgi:translation initiation factor IF-2
MSDENDNGRPSAPGGRAPLTLKPRTGGGSVSAGTVKQSFSHGRSKTVVVETKRARPHSTPQGNLAAPSSAEKRVFSAPAPSSAPRSAPQGGDGNLSSEELRARQRAIELAREQQARQAAEVRAREERARAPPARSGGARRSRPGRACRRSASGPGRPGSDPSPGSDAGSPRRDARSSRTSRGARRAAPRAGSSAAPRTGPRRGAAPRGPGPVGRPDPHL